MYRYGQGQRTSRDIFYVQADLTEHARRDLDDILAMLAPRSKLPRAILAKAEELKELLEDPAVPPWVLIVDGTGRGPKAPIFPDSYLPTSDNGRVVMVRPDMYTSSSSTQPMQSQALDVSVTKHVRYSSRDELPIHYQRTLGMGGFGTVHSATVISKMGRLESTDEVFACKRIPGNRKRGPHNDNFQIELEVLKQVKHQHIVEVVISFEILGRLGEAGFLMRPVADGDLSQLLEDEEHGQSLIQPRWFACISNALTYLHDKLIVHGDIKPSNILYKDNEIFVADFGISRILQQEATIVRTMHAFTRRYAPPELTANWINFDDEDYNPFLAESFSLGCTYFELLQKYLDGRVHIPYDGRSRSYHEVTSLMQGMLSDMRDRLPNYPPELNAILLVPILDGTRRLIEKAPESRLSVKVFYQHICAAPGWRRWDRPGFYCACQYHHT